MDRFGGFHDTNQPVKTNLEQMIGTNPWGQTQSQTIAVQGRMILVSIVPITIFVMPILVLFMPILVLVFGKRHAIRETTSGTNRIKLNREGEVNWANKQLMAVVSLITWKTNGQSTKNGTSKEHLTEFQLRINVLHEQQLLADLFNVLVVADFFNDRDHLVDTNPEPDGLSTEMDDLSIRCAYQSICVADLSIIHTDLSIGTQEDEQPEHQKGRDILAGLFNELSRFPS